LTLLKHSKFSSFGHFDTTFINTEVPKCESANDAYESAGYDMLIPQVDLG